MSDGEVKVELCECEGTKTRAFARAHNNKCPDCGKNIYPEEPKYESVSEPTLPALEEIEDDPIEDQGKAKIRPRRQKQAENQSKTSRNNLMMRAEYKNS